MVHEVHEEQAHCGLRDAALIGGFRVHGENQVFHEVADLCDAGHGEIQVIAVGIFVCEAGDDEVAQCAGLSPNHLECCIEELRKYHEIDSDIIAAGRHYFLNGVLIQEEQIAFLEDDFLAVYYVSRRALAHIDELDEIVSVTREVNEADMRPYINQLTILQNK